jgi:hypothetical protein
MKIKAQDWFKPYRMEPTQVSSVAGASSYLPFIENVTPCQG